MYDVNPNKCSGFAAEIQVKSSPREVSEDSDIILSGTEVFNPAYYYVKSKLCVEVIQCKYLELKM